VKKKRIEPVVEKEQAFRPSNPTMPTAWKKGLPRGVVVKELCYFPTPGSSSRKCHQSWEWWFSQNRLTHRASGRERGDLEKRGESQEGHDKKGA